MRRLLLLASLLLWVPSAYAQSVRYQSQVIGSRGLPLANQNVAVCTQPANTSTQPCSPLATLATSTSTTSGGANPLTTDINGNFFFYAAPGTYTIQIYGPQISTPFVQPDTNVGATGPATFANINKVIYVDQQAGTTADVKFANACAALPAGGGVLDARGFGSGNQTIAALVSCGSATQPVTFLFDPATVYIPFGAATNMFSFSASNTWHGLHIDTTSQATYSGNPIQNNATQGIGQGFTSGVSLFRTVVNMATGSTGPCMAISSTSASVFVIASDFYGFKCSGGTAANGILLQASGAGFVNALHFYAPDIQGTKYGFQMVPGGGSGGGVNGNEIIGYQYEALSGATELAAIHITAPTGTSTANFNKAYYNLFDPGVSTKSAIIDGATALTCGNKFEGLLTPIVDNSSGCVSINEQVDLQSGNWIVPFINAESLLINGLNGGTFRTLTSSRATEQISDQGSDCTNGELALSAGWQSTGTATVTNVKGNGQTCEWTITTGTTTAANPTVTDTLTNALPNATTVCEMIITGGNRTPAAGDSFDQTTLSATAPVFTFQGTPTSGGKTYQVVRRCGP